MSIEKTHDRLDQRFSVSYEYPVCFTRNILAADNDLLCDTIMRLSEPREHRVQVFIDSGVIEAWPDICDRVERYFSARRGKLKLEGPPLPVSGGEQSKNNRNAAESVMESIAGQHLCRQSYVLAIGGGSALDIIGLAAALVHRGVRLVRLPTTVLSQNDSGVGVKNGIDAYGVKNFAGTFVPPFAVLVDFDFLSTLPQKYWVGGVAEAFKVAIIKDPDLFTYLCNNAEALRDREPVVMEQVIRRTAALHLAHIATSGDPFEFGTSRPLDFGHWSAHRLEIMSNYEIGHGQAVAIGICLDSYYAFRQGYLSSEQLDAIVHGIRATGLPVWSDLLERKTSDQLDILAGIEEFREHLGGELHVTLPDGIGAKLETCDMDAGIVREAIDFLKTKVRDNRAAVQA